MYARMSASTAHLEVDDVLRIALTDRGARLAIQLDCDRALQIGATLIEFAMRRPPPAAEPIPSGTTQ
jgi:hypothetical protein